MDWHRNLVRILVACLLLVHGAAHATAQLPDRILIEGKEYPLNTNPLENHLARLGKRPEMFRPPSSGLWRGYIATWALDDGKLLLRRVHVATYEEEADGRRRRGEDRDVIGELFPERGQVVADWYSGALIIPDGELVEYVHMGYGSTYERYIVSVVRQGVEVKRLSLSEREFRHFRDSQFWKFKASDAYKAMFDDMKARQASDDAAYSLSDEQIERFIHEYAAETYLSIVDDEGGDGD